MDKKTLTEFNICLSLASCFSNLNEVFKQNGLDIKLKVESYITSNTFGENHDTVLPLKK